MAKIFKYFWVLFFLYFIFAHPSIIYYNSDFRNTDLSNVAPKEALIYLALSIILWLFIFGFSFHLLLKYSFFTQKNIRNIIRNGTKLAAQIIDVRKLGSIKNGIEIKILSLEFSNLNGVKVWQKIEINDSKPNLNRFEIGKTINLRVDQTFKKSPYYALEDIRSKINLLPFAIWIAFLIGILYYYDYSYNLESAGYGWRFLSLGHPLISSAGFLLLYTGIFYLIFRVFLFKKLNLGKESIVLKFRGLKAFAKVIEAGQTGTYINEQPEIKYLIEFKDNLGVTHQNTIRKIVSLTDIGLVRSSIDKEIFYDPQDPENSMFEEDVNSI